MSLTATILAFTSAIAARIRAPKPQEDLQRAYDCLSREYEQLRHSRGQYIAHVDLLERELATQRSMADHWLRELQRTIRERPLPPLGGQHAQAQNPYISSAAQMQAMQQAQAAMDAMHNTYGYQQLGVPQQNALAQQFDAFCNCVPGRSQLFYEQQAQQQNALVNQLNRT